MALHTIPGLDIHFAAIATSSSTTIVTGQASYIIRVVSMQWTVNGAVNVKWQSHNGPTDLTGFAYPAPNGGLVLPYNPVGWFQTLSGESLDINLSIGVAIGGCLSYVWVPGIL
jgi:hypothetical protein